MYFLLSFLLVAWRWSRPFLCADKYKKYKLFFIMTITYNDRQIELRFSFRADMLFEESTGTSFSGNSESEWLKYMFCNIVAITKDETLKFDDFLDWISENPQTFYDFLKWYTDYQKSVLELRQKKAEDKSTESKKKVSRSRK